MALLSLAAIGMMNATAISSDSEGVSAGDASDPLLKTLQAGVNDTAAGQSELRAWNSFIENFDYQGVILNETMQGNMTYEEAMVATTALLVLNSQSVADAQSITPDEEYADFLSSTINAMKYFNIYLYNMAKLFETRDGRYSAVGREAFNRSMQYYEAGKSEAEFIY
jgi:hypothetical protein